MYLIDRSRLFKSSRSIWKTTELGPLRQRAYAKTETRRQGNSEGTPARLLASTRDHAPLDESSFLLVFRARDFPALSAVPALLLDGKEGSTVQVRQRASLKTLQTCGSASCRGARDVPDADEDVVFVGRRSTGREFRRQIEAG